MKKSFSLLSVTFLIVLCVSAFASCSKKEVVVVKTVESELQNPVPDVTIELVQVDGRGCGQILGHLNTRRKANV